MINNTILVVEDNQDIQEYLRELLLEHNFSVKAVVDGAVALNLIKKSPPDLIVLDLGLPNLSGEEVCKQLRNKYPEIPVIILSARDNISDIVMGLNIGADDYITKPFVGDELIARIKARLRKNENSTTLRIADLELNTKKVEVRRSDKVIALTPKEFRLLHYLMSNKEKVLTREAILNRIWFSSPEIETRVVDVYMGYLRKKIDSHYPKKLIRSVRGFGYTIKE